MAATTHTKRQQQQAALQRYAGDFLAFAADLHVPLGGSSGRLGDHWADFQQRDFAALAPSLLAVAAGRVPSLRRFWIERTKGGSKDSDATVAILWLLLFAWRAIRVQVGAYDQEQASELRYIAKAILNIDAPLNRLLASRIDVQKTCIVGKAMTASEPGGICEILTTDAYGSHGARPDVVIANELSHVGSQAFMETLFDNADKVPHSVVIVATNAGEVSTWQEKWREIAQASDRWHVSILNQPAPWISEADLAESQLRNPPHRFARLWRGIWSSGGGDGISPADIAACTTLVGPQVPRMDRTYIGGLDLGVRRDHSALAILAIDEHRQLVELASIQSWRPADFASGEVDLTVVQQAVVDAQRRYGLSAVAFDPWQCLLMGQQLRDVGVNMIEWPFTSSNKNFMALALTEAFRNQLLRLFPEPALQRDFLRLRIKENPLGGLKLDSVRDADGHADRATAVAIALPLALQAAREGIGEQRESDHAEQLVPY